MTITFSYLAIGLILVLFTRARGIIEESMADFTTKTFPFWAVATFRTILHIASGLLWPIFVHGWLTKPKTLWDALNTNPLFQQQKALAEAMSTTCEDGVDADELPNREGEFGMSASNPIPCKTVFGSTAYLGCLRTLDGAKVAYERISSVASELSPHPVDAYEISQLDGHRLATLFISPYHKRISGKAPRGFQLSDD